MADRIRLLADSVANQIAAGEVVNRPASVVKELMENAVDAGAGSITVNFRDGGRELIQIKDDGCGMSPQDARMAFERHATSKIAAVDDIYALSTFGFRGEALASIAAVAQVEMQTRQQENELGTRLNIDGGTFAGQSAVAAPKGTQIWIRGLFYNVPARKKFLDKATAEATHIISEFQRVALAHPGIAFQLYRDDSPVYNLPAGGLHQRIIGIAGKNAVPKLLEVGVQTSIIRVYGFTGRPSSARQRNKEQFLFVNGRYFKSPFFHKAIIQAYDKLIPQSVQPSYFIYLDTDPEQIDVNVHPQKTEVKFSNQSAVWQIINAAIRETLAKSGAVPMMDFDSEERIEIPPLTVHAGAGGSERDSGGNYAPTLREPASVRSRDYNPFTKYDGEATMRSLGKWAGGDINGDALLVEGSRGVLQDDRSESLRDFASGAERPWKTEGFEVAESSCAAKGTGKTEGFREMEGFSEMEGLGKATGSGRIEITGEIGGSVEIGGSGATVYDHSAFEYIPSAGDASQAVITEFDRPKGFSGAVNIGEGYAATLYGGIFVAVDLRRAREAVLFDRFAGMLRSGHSATQRLLFPERMTLSTDDFELLRDHLQEFGAFGFEMALSGGHTVEIAGVPADIASEGVDEVVYGMLDSLRDGVFAGEEARRQRLAAVMARTGARAGSAKLSAAQTESLLAALAGTANPSYTPWGKPVMAEITLEEIKNKLR